MTVTSGASPEAHRRLLREVFDYSDPQEELFRFLGVPAGDWQSLALALAMRFVPQAVGLDPEAIQDDADEKGLGGRPDEWPGWRRRDLYRAVERIRLDAREGRRPANLSTVKAACLFLATEPAQAMEWGTPETTTARRWAKTLQNRFSEARGIERALAAGTGHALPPARDPDN